MNDQEKVVIQCPTCQTKFEVPGKMLAVAGTPKFHCSRCDSLFVGYEHTPSKNEPLEAPEPMQQMVATSEAGETQEQEVGFDETDLENEETLEEEETEYEEDEDSEEEYEEEDYEEYEEEDSEEDAEEYEEEDEDSDEEEEDSEEYYEDDEESEDEDDDEYEYEEDVVEEEDDEEGDSEEYYDEEDESEEVESDPEMEELTRLTQQESEPTRTRPTVIVDRDMIAEVRRLQEETEAKKESDEMPEPEQVPFRFDPKPREESPQQAQSQEPQLEQPPTERTAVIEEITFPEVEPEATVEREHPEKEDASVVGINFGAPQDDTIEIPEESAVPQSETFAHLGELPPHLTPPPSSLRTISTIGGPLLAFLFVLFFAGEYLKVDSSTTRSIHSALFPNEPQIAPADLRIQDLAFSTIDLSSGKQVPIISGKIVNRSDSAFRSVLLEGVVFDERGQSLKTARASLSNELTKDKMTSLTPEVITQLQDGTSKGRKLLKPGEKREFLLAFPGTENGLKFYTARIYSVKKVG